MPVTVDATGSTRPRGGRSIVSTSTGRLWAISYSGAVVDLFVSNDSGATWAVDAGLSRTLPANVVDAAVFCDIDDNLHLFVEVSGNVGHYYNVRAGAAAPSASTTWQTQSGGASLVAYRNPIAAGWLVNVAYMIYVAGTGQRTAVRTLTVTDPGTSPLTTVDNGTVEITNYVGALGTVSTAPSIDFYHTGDGKTVAGGTPHLFVAWNESDAGILFRKATWTGVGWTWGSNYVMDPMEPAATGGTWRGPFLYFDGVRCVVGWARQSAQTVLQVRERDSGDTATVTLTPTALADGDFDFDMTATYDNARNIYIAAVGATSRDVKQVKYDRVAGTWGAWSTIEAGTYYGPSFKAGQFRQGVDLVYSEGAGAFPVRFNRTVVNTAPTAPTWVDPASVIHNVAVGLLLDWTMNDADGDPQTQYRLVQQVNGGALQEWTGAAWAAPTQTVATSTTQVTIPTGAGTLGSDGDVVDFWVYTYDGVAWSPISTAKRVTMSTLNNPAITAPTGTIVTANTTAMWTVAEQTASRVRLYADAGLTSLLWDSGWETNVVASRIIDYTLSDGVSYWLTVETKNNEGLASNVVSGTFDVDYTEPAVAEVYALADVPDGAVTVVIVNPAPTGTQPVVDHNDVWVRVGAGLNLIGTTARADGDRPVGGDGIRVAKDLADGVDWVDWAVASTVDYQYRVRTFGVNGTAVWSSWAGGTAILDEDGSDILSEDGSALLAEV